MIIKVRVVDNPHCCCSPIRGITIEDSTLSGAVLEALNRLGMYSHVLEARIVSGGTQESESLVKQIIGTIDGSEWGREVRKRKV